VPDHTADAQGQYARSGKLPFGIGSERRCSGSSDGVAAAALSGSFSVFCAEPLDVKLPCFGRGLGSAGGRGSVPPGGSAGAAPRVSFVWRGCVSHLRTTPETGGTYVARPPGRLASGGPTSGDSAGKARTPAVWVVP